MKRISIWLLACCLALLASGSGVSAGNAAAVGASYAIVSDRTSAAAGDDVRITLSGAGLARLYGFEATIAYDPAKLEFVDDTKTFQGFSAPPSAANGKLVVAHTHTGGAAGISGAAPLTVLRFRVVGQGDTDVALTRVRAASLAPDRSIVAASWDESAKVRIALGGGYTGNSGNSGSIGNTDDNGNTGNTGNTRSTESTRSAVNAGNSGNTGASLLAAQGIQVPLQEAASWTAADGLLRVSIDPGKVRALLRTAAAKATELHLVLPDSAYRQLQLELGRDVLDAFGAGSAASLVLDSPIGSRKLPIAHLSRLASPPSESVTITISPSTAAVRAQFETGGAVRGMRLIGDPLVFAVTAADADGKPQNARGFALKSASIVMPVTGKIDPGRSAVVALRSDGAVVPVPAVFVRQADGSYAALLKHADSGTYAIVTGNGTDFADLSGHWAATDIARLASRLLVEGVSPGIFDPDRPMTRAEFATLIVRALGASDSADDTAAFRDVSDDDWFAPAVHTAYAMGIVQGADGRFEPRRTISRQEIAVMLSRTMAWAEQAAPSANVKAFADDRLVRDWARDGIAAVSAAGIMQGDAGGALKPTAASTRAETAAMLKRLLEFIDYMDS